MKSDQNILQKLSQTVAQLADPKTYNMVCHEHRLGEPLPSSEKLARIVNMVREILFPGYFGNTSLRVDAVRHS